jgi:lipopolysaccharide biosynthesis protein|tara:strand:+ start:289 stop:906 length:618 start_codon:yes stop_codon:yes gene_type:complete
MIAIVLHIYYTEMWEHYKNKLQSLDTKFDLYITLCDEVEDISKDILKSFPTANIKKYKNKGQDIGPFLLTLKDIRHKDYDYLIKLHTKKCEYNLSLGSSWGDELTNSLISSDYKIKENISILKQAEYKMCGSKKWFKDNAFIGGTMFMVDFKILLNCLPDELIDAWYAKMPYGYVQDGSFTHGVERLLGKIIVDAGYKIKGVSEE